ncbi:MAG: ferritin-like domain-containing protein [Anaerolineae bacterium]
MELKSVHNLFLSELADMYDAEQQITKALPQMIEETQDPKLKNRLQTHLEETQQQVKNLEACFQSLGEKAKAEKCMGIAGIIGEKQKMSGEKPSQEVLQAIDLGAGLKVENYEIASYTSLIGMAVMMGHAECERLLKENLQQENDMARFLEQNAARLMDELGSRTGEKNMAGNGRGNGGAHSMRPNAAR